jgi:hypothetical protein
MCRTSRSKGSHPISWVWSSGGGGSARGGGISIGAAHRSSLSGIAVQSASSAPASSSLVTPTNATRPLRRPHQTGRYPSCSEAHEPTLRSRHRSGAANDVVPIARESQTTTDAPGSRTGREETTRHKGSLLFGGFSIASGTDYRRPIRGRCTRAPHLEELGEIEREEKSRPLSSSGAKRPNAASEPDPHPDRHREQGQQHQVNQQQPCLDRRERAT